MEKNGALQFVDTAEAATLLGVSEWAVLRDCESGRLPAEYVPTHQGVEWRVPLDALSPSRSEQPSRVPSTTRPVRAPSDARTENGQAETDGGICLAHEILPRIEERIAGLQTAVEALTAQVESLADETARLRDEVICGARLPVTSVAQSLTEANAELREQLRHVTVGCRKLAQFIFDLEEVTNGSGTGAK
jgi:hypothetical protein